MREGAQILINAARNHWEGPRTSCRAALAAGNYRNYSVSMGLWGLYITASLLQLSAICPFSTFVPVVPSFSLLPLILTSIRLLVSTLTLDLSLLPSRPRSFTLQFQSQTASFLSVRLAVHSSSLLNSVSLCQSLCSPFEFKGSLVLRKQRGAPAWPHKHLGDIPVFTSLHLSISFPNLILVSISFSVLLNSSLAV